MKPSMNLSLKPLLVAVSPDTVVPSAAHESDDPRLKLCGQDFIPHSEGALYWEAQRTLLVADLHLEKGAAFARRGSMLPPYDTRMTLWRLRKVIDYFEPARVVALGDSFHTSEVAAFLPEEERETIAELQDGREWYWVTGNHDPEIPSALGGTVCESLAIGGITCRHEPTRSGQEIAGHLHPVARITARGEAIRRKCFATDGDKMVMPAFGSYAGGLSIFSDAFAGLLSRDRLAAWLLGRDAVYPIFGAALFRG
ncbi:hypothetical protein A7A08_01814 [Methyloligella halotolerans]|uniref:Calcineurin-like phosphoesterase domain-containing protein n=2 Tax=Methyloligella halotolerans TaxID=1177755 RepID=A0A1E2RY47_9HYPH|nr:hypothetical protein A7A08_01814 [Methyloligella halotolerans]